MRGDVTLILLTLVIKTGYAASRTPPSFIKCLCHTHSRAPALKLELWGAQSTAAQFNCKQNMLATPSLRLIAYLHYNWVYNQTIN